MVLTGLSQAWSFMEGTTECSLTDIRLIEDMGVWFLCYSGPLDDESTP